MTELAPPRQRRDAPDWRQFLRRIPLFAGVSDAVLDQLLESAETQRLPAGEVIMEEGEQGDALYVILDGELQVTKRQGDRELVLAVVRAGDFIGEMALVDEAPRSATVRTLGEAHVLVIRRAAFEVLFASDPAVPRTILRTVSARLHSTERLLMQQQKMAALGTLAAGLAHELNNPAAAIRRSAEQLREELSAWERSVADLGTLAAGRGEAIGDLRGEIARRAATPAHLDPIATSAAEDEVQDWLEGRGVDAAWELAPALVSFGWDLAALERLEASFSAAELPVVVRWIAASSTARGMLDELRESAEAISEIVKAVKTYSYLDQAPVQEVDVHAGLETTLVILRHKLKGGVKVVREYAADLPRVEAFGSELNQVWTNLIDNAVDAMQGRGELVLRTYPKDRSVVVEIRDSGPGIPPDLQARVFEPFFTTKEPGVGTGLGLYIAHNIVVQRHHGHIEVESQPGATRFSVTLPLRLATS